MLDINNQYYHAYLSKKHLFGLIRISKCASTSLINYRPWKLSSIPVEFDLFASQSLPLYACIRHPAERFISSISETLLRFTLLTNRNRHCGGAIYVPSDVYLDISRLIHQHSSSSTRLDASKFILDYIELINNHGFFDAHHTPQSAFISTHYHPYLKDLIFLFDQSRLPAACSLINKTHQIRTEQVPITYNCASKKLLSPYQRGFKLLTPLLTRSLYHSTKISLPWTSLRVENPFKTSSIREDLIFSLIQNKRSFAQMLSGNCLFNSLYASDLLLWRTLSSSESPLLSLKYFD